jgi:hypothetical protein
MTMANPVGASRLIIAVSVAFLLGTSVGAQAPREPEGEALADGEPEILPEEVVAPATDWSKGWGGQAPPWYEDPRTIECGGRPSCEDAKAGAVADYEAAEDERKRAEDEQRQDAVDKDRDAR